MGSEKDKLFVRSTEFDELAERRIEAVRALDSGAHVHISGICGTGTAQVAELLKSLGFYVTGSDKAFYPPMGEVVKEVADKVFEGYAADNLEPRPDLVVIGNSLTSDNPEAVHVLEQGIAYASMPEVFSALLIGTHEQCPTSIVVTGTSSPDRGPGQHQHLCKWRHVPSKNFLG